MTKRLTIALYLLFVFSPSLQAKSLQDVQTLLAAQSLVRGDFEQHRTMEMFSQPLTSTGNFVIHKKSGLLWQQTAPFPVNIILTDDKLSQQFANQPAQVMTEKENPMAFYFSHIFLSLFDGNAQQLNQQFTTSFSDNAEVWTLTLTPNQAPLNAVFSDITISGTLYINQIELTEVRGDKTTILFNNQTEQPNTLTPDESAFFHF
ncbi:outer membrane lipoprotein carrier protein LolA [Vibrio sp. F74]|uniref:LolA family protein n=1 Tax=Vibrio sp. F74 TaxID=700020 RepID=UPI0035F59806